MRLEYGVQSPYGAELTEMQYLTQLTEVLNEQKAKFTSGGDELSFEYEAVIRDSLRAYNRLANKIGQEAE